MNFPLDFIFVSFLPRSRRFVQPVHRIRRDAKPENALTVVKCSSLSLYTYFLLPLSVNRIPSPLQLPSPHLGAKRLRERPCDFLQHVLCDHTTSLDLVRSSTRPSRDHTCPRRR